MSIFDVLSEHCCTCKIGLKEKKKTRKEKTHTYLLPEYSYYLTRGSRENTNIKMSTSLKSNVETWLVERL